jgi:preprotein translocase subunit YajC
MNGLFPTLSFLQAAGDTAAAGDSSTSFIMSLLPLVAIIAVFYFLIIRPQNKKQKEMQKMIDTLDKGDKVITIGGVHATVHSVKEHTVVLKVDDECKMEFSKSAIGTVVSKNGVEIPQPGQKK